MVLGLAGWYGPGPAVAASVGGFLAYDHFFVPSVGSLTVSAPRESVDLVILLAASLLTSYLGGLLRLSRRRALQTSWESVHLVELATAAIRTQDVAAAIRELSRRSTELKYVDELSVVVMGSQGAVVMGGSPLPGAELRRAEWAFEKRLPIGARLAEGQVHRMRRSDGVRERAHIPTPSGVIVLKLRPDGSDADESYLAALVGVLSLLLDRARLQAH